MTLAGTGHRPDKLCVNGYSGAVRARLVDLAWACLEKHEPDTVLTGMALGWDSALALAAHAIGIRYVAYVPFKGQECMWPEESRKAYHVMLDHAYHVEICSDGGYTALKMQIRNQKLVDSADRILALWNGTPGGTANCLKYARHMNKPIYNVWQSWARGNKMPVKEEELI